MNHGSLFSGIGGFDLAAEMMGWNNVFHCEIEPFPRKILNYYWPKAISYEDIKTTDFTVHRGQIDVLTGGFPCQPYSVAGSRKGKEDDRHLWPEMLRAIRECQPTWIVGENVPGIISWNGGLVFEEVCVDLENEGYEVQPVVLPAASKDAPHKRDRVWFVAHSKSIRPRGEKRQCGREGCNKAQHGDQVCSELRDSCLCRDVANADSERWNDRRDNREERQLSNNINRNAEEGEPKRDGRKRGPGQDGEVRDAANANHQRLKECHNAGIAEQQGWPDRKFTPLEGWQNFPTQSPVRSRNDGLSRRMVRYLTKEVYNEISKTSEENRIQNLQEVWQKIQSKEIWEAIRRLYSLESKEILLQTMQLYSEGNKPQINISPFSERVSGEFLRHLRKYGEFRRSPQGRQLQKQRSEQFRDTLSFMPHEVALAAGRFEAAITKFDAWHRNESIKAYGNAVVPQVVVEIFKVIEIMHKT